MGRRWRLAGTNVILDPSPGDVILDLAAGTGVVGVSAAALVGPTGRVIVSDFAGAMVEVASRRGKELALDNVRSASDESRLAAALCCDLTFHSASTWILGRDRG